MVWDRRAVPSDLGEVLSYKLSPIFLQARTPPPMENRPGQTILWPQLLWAPAGLVTQVWESERWALGGPAVWHLDRHEAFAED